MITEVRGQICPVLDINMGVANRVARGRKHPGTVHVGDVLRQVYRDDH